MKKYSKDSKGRYVKTLTIGREADGKYKRKYFRASTLKELEDKISKYKNDLYRGINPDIKYSFQDISHLWLESKVSIASNTLKQYEVMLSTEINPFFGHVGIKDLRLGDLNRLLTILCKKGKSESYLKKVKIICVGVLKYALNNGLILYNAFSNAEIPDNAPKGTRDVISKDQEEAIFTYWKGHRMGLSALLMLLCGLRRGELLALQWSDIDLDKKVLHITKSVTFDNNKPVVKDGGKTESATRMIPLTNSLIKILESYKRDSLYICCSAKKEIMTETAFVRAWNSFMHYLNISCGGRDRTNRTPKIEVLHPFTPHQLRHTFATNLLHADVHPKVAQYLLGHSSISVTFDTYTHHDPEKSYMYLDKYNKNINAKLDSSNSESLTKVNLIS